MILKQLTEVTWRLYQDGSANVKTQTFKKPDVTQMVMMGAANAFRELYYASKKTSDYNTPDYSFSSPLLSVKPFDLPEANIIGKRRIDMSDFDLYRLPRNSHITNIYPETGDGCGNEEVGEITLVSPGEENFYIGNPDFKTMQFGVVKGRGIDTYNIPPCIKSLSVETTFATDDVDISLDVAYDVSSKILVQLLKTEEITGEVQTKLRGELQKMEGIK